MNTVVTEIATLRELTTGPVSFPGDEHYDTARRAWNLAVDQRPAAVVLAQHVDDVVATVRFARENGFRVAPQATGHGACTIGDLGDTILLRTADLRGVIIHPRQAIARAEAGAQWQDVVGAAAVHGLAAMHGSAPDIGVVGYSLGGGLGWYGRKHGLAANHVTAIELVLADGELRRVDACNDPELFWGLRGGGSFGIVTAIEMELLPIEEAYAGWLIFPWERSREVLGAWAAWTRETPETVTSVGRILQIPPIPEIPEPLRGRQLVVIEATFLESEKEASRLLEPLRALGPELDTFATVPQTALMELHQDPPSPVPGIGHHAIVETLPETALDAFVGAAGPGSGSAMVSVELRQLGGALARRPVAVAPARCWPASTRCSRSACRWARRRASCSRPRPRVSSTRSRPGRRRSATRTSPSGTATSCTTPGPRIA